MEHHDLKAFLTTMTTMAELFCDEMSEQRQLIYWECFKSACTLAEWEKACAHAMRQETFYKVPLPAILAQYIAMYRPHQLRLVI